MIKRIKHSLEHLLDKSSQKKTSQQEEKLLNDFSWSVYQNSQWDEDKMGSSKETSAQLYKGIQFQIEKKKTFPPYFKYGVAASIILLVSLGFLFKEPSSVEQLTFQTAALPKSIQLADGSKVYLASYSKLNYPAHFEGNERNVSLLKGNAFFEIAKDKKHPFIIASGDIKTKVLGTSFHIQLSQSKCEVIVVTGKVNVSSKNQNIDLVPNEMASFEGQKLTKKRTDSSLLVNWYAEDVMLNQVTLKQVITIIQYKYGVKFEYNNEQLLATPVTVFVEKEASLESVLQQINYITNLKFNVNGEIVKVK